MELEQSWRFFLQYVELMRNYNLPYAPDAAGPAPKNPLLERFLPSLFLIYLVSVLDEATQGLMEQSAWTLPHKWRDNLFNRLRFLSEQGALLDHPALDKIRSERNDVAHAVVFSDWETLDGAIATVQTQLEAWGFVGAPPRYEFFSERIPLDASPDSRDAFGFEYRFGLKEEGQPVVTVRWEEPLGTVKWDG